MDLDLTRTSSSNRDPGTLAVALPTTGTTAPLFSWPSLDASGLEDFYLHPDHYEGASLVVPSSVWGEYENPYLVVSFAAMARGSVGGDNLSVGSMVQAGSAQMALAHCETGPATQSSARVPRIKRRFGRPPSAAEEDEARAAALAVAGAPQGPAHLARGARAAVEPEPVAVFLGGEAVVEILFRLSCGCRPLSSTSTATPS